MAFKPGSLLPRRSRTILGRLVLAATFVLVPIFGLAIAGFLQLDSHSQRFSAVASEAAVEMRLIDELLKGIERADYAVDAYLEEGAPRELAVVARVRPGVDATLARSRRFDDAQERELAVAATRRWASVLSRLGRAEDLWRAGRRPPAALASEHESDVQAVEALVASMLASSRVEIEREVARGREERIRDLWLLALQIVLGLGLAGALMHRAAAGIVRPLARLGVATERLRTGHHAERVAITGPAELERMGAVFNEMAGTLQEQQADLRRLAYADPLTGLPNRAALLEAIEAAVALQRPATVLFLDLDDFKSVNDALSHSAGDELLVQVGRRIAETVGSAGTVARLGGDEFAVLVAGGPEDPVRIADRVLEALSWPMRIGGVEVVPAGSLGIATGTRDAGGLLRDADVAMYEAKREGRHGHATFEPGMRTAAAERLAGIADLRQALDDDQFTVVYQPIVDLRSREVRAAEALVRWEHPERGVVSPAQFIPLAEQTGLIVGIGVRVLREACRQAAAWEAERPAAPTMTVNLSARQLLEPELVGQVEAALADAGLAPERLMLEITESAVMADPEAAIARLAALRALGVRLAIDDFGTGHSSLAYLRELPVHELKIAREFVAGMEESAHDLALARGILGLGHGLHLRVIAEGIETEAQHDRLRTMGCDRGQGYLYARPLDAAALAALLPALEQPPVAFVAGTGPTPLPAAVPSHR